MYTLPIYFVRTNKFRLNRSFTHIDLAKKYINSLRFSQRKSKYLNNIDIELLLNGKKISANATR